jgi:broad specificity phosphatase PhoE
MYRSYAGKGSMTVQLIYETHSTTTDNEAGIATGWLPGQLSEAGRRQAEELGQRRRNEAIAAVFVSDLARAVQTAQIAFGDAGMLIYQDPRLRECNYGRFNGTAAAQLVADRLRYIKQPYPQGESYCQVVARVQSFLRDLAAGWDGHTVLVISHSAPLWALECLLGGARLDELVGAPFVWQPGWRYIVP